MRENTADEYLLDWIAQQPFDHEVTPRELRNQRNHRFVTLFSYMVGKEEFFLKKSVLRFTETGNNGWVNLEKLLHEKGYPKVVSSLTTAE